MPTPSVRLQLTKPITLSVATLAATILFVLFHSPHSSSSTTPHPMAARSFILWLHGLGDSGPANEPIKSLFTSPEFKRTSWSFPSAPNNPVTCNYGAVMPSWFDIHEIPVTADSPKAESSVLEAVQSVHAKIDKVVDGGISPNNIFVCGFSQGGALTLASVLLYPKTLGGGAVFSGWVPFNSTIIDRIHPDAKRTPILWSHGIDDRTVLFEAGQAGPPFLEKAGKVLKLLLNGESIGKLRSNGGKAKLLVGHDLEHDLDCLRMNYPDHMLRDTARYHPLMKTNLVSHSLKYLTRAYLGYDIRQDGHDPYENCVSVMRLYKRMRSLDHRRQVMTLSVTPSCIQYVAPNLDSHSAKDLEKMTPDELYEMSRTNFKCWCHDSRRVMQT